MHGAGEEYERGEAQRVAEVGREEAGADGARAEVVASTLEALQARVDGSRRDAMRGAISRDPAPAAARLAEDEPD